MIAMLFELNSAPAQKRFSRVSVFASLRRLAPCLSLAYLLLFVFTLLHTHEGLSLLRSRDVHAAVPTQTETMVPSSDTLTSVTELHAGKDCTLCDFLVTPMQVATLPEVYYLAWTQVSPVAPVERRTPFLPFRFCDRSASRAPPLA
jgi:hypothetical protein